MAEENWTPDLTAEQLLTGAEPRPTIAEGYNTFVTPFLPRRIEGVTPDDQDTTESLVHGSTVFVSADFYDRVHAAQHPEET